MSWSRGTRIKPWTLSKIPLGGKPLNLWKNYTKKTREKEDKQVCGSEIVILTEASTFIAHPLLITWTARWIMLRWNIELKSQNLNALWYIADMSTFSKRRATPTSWGRRKTVMGDYRWFLILFRESCRRWFAGVPSVSKQKIRITSLLHAGPKKFVPDSCFF